jgi:hypothetical protein
LIGRKDLCKGPLFNLTDGGAGTVNLVGEAKARMLAGARRGGSKAGPRNGKRAKDSGLFARNCQTREVALRGAQAVNHQRWHLARGIVEPGCRLCYSIKTG